MGLTQAEIDKMIRDEHDRKNEETAESLQKELRMRKLKKQLIDSGQGHLVEWAERKEDKQ